MAVITGPQNGKVASTIESSTGSTASVSGALQRPRFKAVALDNAWLVVMSTSSFSAAHLNMRTICETSRFT